MSPHFTLYCLICLMVLCWSGNYVAAKIVFREIPAMLVMCLRTVVAGGADDPDLLAACAQATDQWTLARSRACCSRWACCGMSHEPVLLDARGGADNGGAFVDDHGDHAAVGAADGGHDAAWSGSRGRSWSGMVIAIAGRRDAAGVPVRAASANGPTLAGDFLVLLCALLLAGMTAFGKRYKPQSGGIAVNAVGYMWRRAAAAAGVLVDGPRISISAASRAAAWAGVFYMGAFSSVTGYLIYYYALARMPASRMAAFQYLQPVFASLMAVMILGEQLSGAGACGRRHHLRGRVTSRSASDERVHPAAARPTATTASPGSGQVVSEVGDHFNNIAVMSLAMEHPHPGLVVTGVFLSRAVADAGGGPDCGRAAGPAEPQARHDRERPGAGRDRARLHRLSDL